MGDQHIHYPIAPPYEAPPLPPQGELPPASRDFYLGSRMAYGRNPQFTGRTDELHELARILLYSDQQQQTAVITQPAIASGMGGIGKTQLAVEFVYRYGRYFSGGVYWLNFSNPEGIGSEIADCLGALSPAQQATFPALDLPTRTRLVQMAWQGPTPRLLIFDNLDDEAAVSLLEQYGPKSGGCRLLITSRRATWPASLGAALRPLRTLPRPDSITLLQTLITPNQPQQEQHLPLSPSPALPFSPTSPDPALDRIADALGDLPLALHLAGSYLHTYRRTVTPSAYLEELAAQTSEVFHRSLSGKGAEHSPTGHELHVARTFALSYERLNPADPTDRLALALLARLACFAPVEAVPLTLLQASLPNAAELEPTDLDDALHRLRALGLIEDTDGAGAMHRLIATFVQAQTSDETAQADVEQAVIKQAYADNMSGYPQQLLSWQSHLRHVTDAALPRADETAANLATNLGYHLNAMGDYAGARPLYERALGIREKALDPDHQNEALLRSTATSLNNLAYLLYDMGDYAGARPLHERALAIWEKALGPDHPDTATSLNNLAGLLYAMGDYAGARPLYKRALVIREKALGPDHPDTGMSYGNLAGVYQATYDYQKALPFRRKALDIHEKSLGENHPITATSLNNLAVLLDIMGDYTAARPLYEHALAIREKALGSDHPAIATSLNNLAALLDDMGDYDGARPLYERALAIREKALGPDHPNTATSLNNLAGLLESMGDYVGARPLYERALAIKEKVLGPDHPATATSLNNLAGLLDAMGDYAGARPLYERALIIVEAQLGPDHPHTQTVRRNLQALP
jgi:tetratricopeptide (TPR) repeat protein